ncbi:MAG: hypothetical protein AB7R40_23720 [Nitrospiraceae bacterium]
MNRKPPTITNAPGINWTPRKDGQWKALWRARADLVETDTEEDARALLSAALTEHGLDGRRPFTLRRISTDDPRAFILQDGDY